MGTDRTTTDILEYIKVKEDYGVDDVKLVLCYGNFCEYLYDFMEYMLTVLGREVGGEEKYQVRVMSMEGIEKYISEDESRVIQHK